MTEIEQLQHQLQKQEKLASLGMLSAGIAHEIQNPLNFVINFSKMSARLLDDLTDILQGAGQPQDAGGEWSLSEADREDLSDIVADLKENMGQIAENGERAVSIIQGILLVSRGKENEFIPSDVCHIVKEYVRLAYHAMRANQQGFNVTIRAHYQEDLPPVMVIPQDLSRAVLNVMNNACYAVWKKAASPSPSRRGDEASPSPSRRGDVEEYVPEISISVQGSTVNECPMVTITIADNGEGMSDEVKQHLFDNFFTTKPIGEGTGLGMAITRDIIENKHKGKITFTSTEGQGTTFTFTIPVACGN